MTTGVTVVVVVAMVVVVVAAGADPTILEVVIVVEIATVASSATNQDISPGTAGKLTGATNVIKWVILLGTVRSQDQEEELEVMVVVIVAEVEIVIQILHVTTVTRRVTSLVNAPNPTGNLRVAIHVANQVT